MSLVHVFAASAMEGKLVRELAPLANAETPARCGANDVLLTITGMGPKNAKSKAEAALARTDLTGSQRGGPDSVLVMGLCGGLAESLSEGQIVAYSECRSTESSRPVLSCSPVLLNAMISHLETSPIRCEEVVGITSSRIATTRTEKLALANRGAAAVDMESYEIVKAASSAGIPAAVLRVVSDSADRELPDFNRALDDSGGLDARRALLFALRSPVRTAKLLAANRRALQRLGEALEPVLKSDLWAEVTSDRRAKP